MLFYRETSREAPSHYSSRLHGMCSEQSALRLEWHMILNTLQLSPDNPWKEQICRSKKAL